MSNAHNSGTASMQGVFISYRRLDSQSAAGRLADHLKKRLPNTPLFRDVETIEPGVDFVDAINRALQSCGVLLAVIGPRWISLTDANGRRRLDDPNDYTRLEIVTALQRSNVRVIPVLVEGAGMPRTEELPEDLQPLCRRNAIELTDRRWDYDVGQLEETLRKALNIDPAPNPRPTPDPKPIPDPIKPEPVTTSLPWYKRLTTKQWWYIAGAVVVLAAIDQQIENRDDYLDDYSSYNSAPVNAAPANTQTNTPINTQTTLTGYWQDNEGGKYEVYQQGNQVALRGTNSGGTVYGTGVMANNQISLNYTVNGVPYAAMLMVGADGKLTGQYGSNVSGLSGEITLSRVR
ncbi:MAG: toll/interleukin-1 receptor domain-containing protein [Steroidobacteraceae bacterium]